LANLGDSRTDRMLTHKNGEVADASQHSMAELHAARPGAQRFPLSGHLVLLLVLCLVEAIIFFWTVLNRVTANFPIGFDPLSYFAYTYDLIARTTSGGWIVIIDEFVHPRQSNGLSFTVQGTLLGLLFGSNRDLTSQSDYGAITQLNTAIGRYVVENKLLKPTFPVDRVVGYLNWGTLRLGTFEVLRTWIDFDPRFGASNYGIFATPREVALQLIKDSDIVVLTDPIQGRSSTLPIDRKIIEYWDELDAWTRRNRLLLTSADVYGVPHRVYVRQFDRTTAHN
jgi:hypothetical protein